jgi:hypothetical protein
MDMTIRKYYNGTVEFSTVQNNIYYHRVFMGYTMKQSEKLFRKYVREKIREEKYIHELLKAE